MTSDRPILECLNREQRAHNADGSLRTVIPPPLTPEQKAARDEEAQRKVEAEKRADEQKRRDRSLLSSYSSVDSLERARQRALGDAQAALERSHLRIAELQKEAKTLEAEKEFYPKGKLPASVQRRIEDNAFALRYETETRSRREEEIARINQRFDTDRARLTELLNGTAR